MSVTEVGRTGGKEHVPSICGGWSQSHTFPATGKVLLTWVLRGSVLSRRWGVKYMYRGKQSLGQRVKAINERRRRWPKRNTELEVKKKEGPQGKRRDVPKVRTLTDYFSLSLSLTVTAEEPRLSGVEWPGESPKCWKAGSGVAKGSRGEDMMRLTYKEGIEGRARCGGARRLSWPSWVPRHFSTEPLL